MTKLDIVKVVAVLLTFHIIGHTAQAVDLFNPDEYQALAADKRGFRVGDNVTLIIVESARAESSAGTKGDKEFAASAEASDLHNSKSVAAGIGASSQADARTSRRGFLSAQLSVTVVGKNQYGNLIVSGDQKIVINGEEQEIRVSGVLRPEDIDRDNRAISSVLTSAEIQFLGEGTVGDSQSHNIIYNILNWLGIL